MSNLCQEITLQTKPIQHIDDENGEIALCILSAINVGNQFLVGFGLDYDGLGRNLEDIYIIEENIELRRDLRQL